MYLPQPCAFDPKERAFFWVPSAAADPASSGDTTDPSDPSATAANPSTTASTSTTAPPSTSTPSLLLTPPDERMYIDTHDTLRVRVEADEFYDHEPGPPRISEGGVVEVNVKGKGEGAVEGKAGYTVYVSGVFR